MKKTLITIFIASLFGSLFSQSLNVELFDVVNRGDQRYSGSWSYTAPDGKEYALLGAYSGLAAYSIDDAPVTEVGFVAGPGSNWREITVVKDHAYVTTEGSGIGQGLQVVSLEYLPDSLHLIRTYDEWFVRGHILQSDVYSPDSTYIYVNGATQALGDSILNGVMIFDVSNPANIVYVGGYHPYYIHDCHVRGDRLYAAAIYEGTLDVVDISDKSNPQLLTRINYPNGFTHSSWTSGDNNYLYVCDEVDGLPMRTFDISDLDDVTEIIQAQYTANPAALVHNPYVRGNYLFASHNTEGLRVLDIAKPDVPVEVGYYDTYSGASGGFSGLWSACPFFPSGKIIGGDRTNGLYVWQHTEVQAGRIYGIVRDSVTNDPLAGVSVTLSTTVDTDIEGKYALGALPGMYSMTLFKSGYAIKTIDNINLQAADSLWLETELTPMDVSTDLPLHSNSGIKVYPNPFEDDITIELTSLDVQAERMIIYNSTGKIMNDFFIKNSLSNNYNISIPHTGLYFYEIFNDKNEVIGRGKLVKK